eukprot:scaffold333566_cov33-Attheya_sp.AAC.2
MNMYWSISQSAAQFDCVERSASNKKGSAAVLSSLSSLYCIFNIAYPYGSDGRHGTSITSQQSSLSQSRSDASSVVLLSIVRCPPHSSIVHCTCRRVDLSTMRFISFIDR